MQAYNKFDKKHTIVEYIQCKYIQEIEAKVHEYRYRQSHVVGHAVSWVHLKPRSHRADHS